jgi:hypothetical protein
MQSLVAGLLVATSASPALARIRDWKIFQMPPVDVQQRQAEIFDPYPMTDIGPLDRTVRPPMWQYPTPEAARQRWPAPGTFPRVRLPEDLQPMVPQQRFMPPAQPAGNAQPAEEVNPELQGEPVPPGEARPQARRAPKIQSQMQPAQKIKRPLRSARRTQSE